MNFWIQCIIREQRRQVWGYRLPSKLVFILWEYCATVRQHQWYRWPQSFSCMWPQYCTVGSHVLYRCSPQLYTWPAMQVKVKKKKKKRKRKRKLSKSKCTWHNPPFRHKVTMTLSSPFHSSRGCSWCHCIWGWDWQGWCYKTTAHTARLERFVRLLLLVPLSLPWRPHNVILACGF